MHKIFYVLMFLHSGFLQLKSLTFKNQTIANKNFYLGHYKILNCCCYKFWNFIIIKTIKMYNFYNHTILKFMKTLKLRIFKFIFLYLEFWNVWTIKILNFKFKIKIFKNSTTLEFYNLKISINFRISQF